jgi:hypothetical protein
VGTGGRGTRYISPPWIIGKESELEEGNIPVINVKNYSFLKILLCLAYFTVITNK